jgi:peptidoglycan hydrolase-like protein with peptidoglycan-binding domain
LGSAAGGGTGVAAGGGTEQAATGTITGLAATGSWIDLGDIVYTADGSPVLALRGSVPAWRSLSTASEDGVDVRQLEESLVELGYDSGGDITVDETLTSATAAAVAAWQEGLGLEATGTVDLGTMVFLPEAVEVTGHSTAVGSGVADGNPVLTVATPSRQVVAEVPDNLQTVVEPGLVVDIETDSGEATGVVAFLRAATVEDDTGDTSVVVEAVVTPREPLPDGVAGAEADVTVTVEGEAGVLTVPAEAVASRLDGSYAVQLVGPDGQATWVPVEIVGTVGQETAVRGAGIEAGATVLEPA